MQKLYLLFMFSGEIGNLNCFVVRLPNANTKQTYEEILNRDRITINGKKHHLHTWMIGISDDEKYCWWDIPIYTTESYHPEPIEMWEFRQWMEENNIQELHENFFN